MVCPYCRRYKDLLVDLTFLQVMLLPKPPFMKLQNVIIMSYHAIPHSIASDKELTSVRKHQSRATAMASIGHHVSQHLEAADLKE